MSTGRPGHRRRRMSARVPSVRRRLLGSSVLVVLTAVVLLGVPLGWAGSRLVQQSADQRLERTARSVLDAVHDRVEHHESVGGPRLAALLPPGVHVRLVSSGAPPVEAGATSNDEQQTLTLPAGRDGLRVTVSERDDAVRHRQGQVWLLVGLVSALAVAAATLLAARQARRLAALLDELAQAADRLGSGDLRPHPRRYRLAELDRVADVLDRSAHRLAGLLRRERDVSASVSHQLRTPLAALSLRLEEVAQVRDDPDAVREEVDAALGQIDRLTGTVEHLLEHARGTSDSVAAAPNDLIDPVDVIGTAIDELAPLFARASRRIRCTGDSRGLGVGIARGSLAQAVSVLLDNALRHGAGAVTVNVGALEHSAVATGDPRWTVVVQVLDEGPGVTGRIPGLSARDAAGISGGDGSGDDSERRGLGLPLARALVEAGGGRLELADAACARFVLYLPARPRLAGRG